MALNLKKLNESDGLAEKRREAEKEARDRSFRQKIAIQQFMNHNGPLFRAFAKAGTSIDELVEGEIIRVPASQAMRLAVLVAAKLANKPPEDVTAAEAKPFRSEAAEWVATRWLEKKPVDVERAASEIASAVGLADGSWDYDAYKDDRISDDASLMITAAGVAGSLARQVEIYDFRAGKDAVLGRLVKTVVETATRSAVDMLSKEASVSDVRNLTQTLARNLSALMEACYERKAREVVGRLNGRPEREKAAWFAAHSPLDDVMASFREWTLCLGGYAVAASREMAPPSERESPDQTKKA